VKLAICLAPAAVLAAATFLLANSLSPDPNGLTVHEWGTFTSVAAEDGSSANWDALGCKDDLPRFVRAAGYRGFKFRLNGTVRMETPVLYFYSPRAVDAKVQVAFLHGVITEWYPDAEDSIYESKGLLDHQGRLVHQNMYSEDAVYPTANLLSAPLVNLDPLLVKLDASMNGIDTTLRHLVGTIAWDQVRVQPGTAPAFPFENQPSRYYAARATDAAPLAVSGQAEKFLFYRGVARLQAPLSARILPGGYVQVQNLASETVPGVILFENRGGHLGYRSAGSLTGTATLGRPSLDGSFAALRNDLQAALVAQGLFVKEAQAMIDTWRDSWFEEGARLIYLVPSQTVNSLLPLQIEPPPAQIARVFVGRIELIPPETEDAVQQALAQNDWNMLDRYSRFLGPILERMYDRDSAKAANAVRAYQGSQDLNAAGGCR
jgi:hypothetical protein